MYNGSVQQRSFSLAEAVRIPYSRRNPSKSLSSLAPLYFSMVILMLWCRSLGCELDCVMACRVARVVACWLVCAAAICKMVSCSVRKRPLMSLDSRSEEDDEEDEADDEDGGASLLTMGVVV